MTTQNAALVEEASAATQSLAGQSQSLAQLVAFFDLGTPGATTRPAGQPPQRRGAPASVVPLAARKA